MKNLLFIFGISLIALFFSCSTEQEETVTDEVLGSVSEVIFTASDFDYMETLSTRTDFVINDSGAGFQWSTKDTIGIFPDAGSQVYFPMENGAGTNSAKFTGGGWALKGSSTYYAYYPFCRRYSLSDEIINKIPVMFERQSQEGNACTSALGAFDYMAASGSSPVSGALNFRFEHLGALAQISVTVPSASAFTQLELIPSNLEFISQGFYDLKAGVPAIVGLETSNKLTLDLLNVSTSSDGETLTFYMMLPPTDLEVENLTVMLNAAGGNYCRGTLEFNKQLKAGKAYQMNFSSTEMIQMLTNQNLIAAAEASTGMTFIKDDDGVVYLDLSENRTIVDLVTVLNLSNMGDPFVTDEIGAFKNLQVLKCQNNGIKHLDLTLNAALIKLECYDNPLGTLDVSNNMNLKYLDCDRTELNNIDISQNTALTVLWCGGNKISMLDVKNNVLLDSLCIYNTSLSHLDLANNEKLTYLYCPENKLEDLDVSSNINLKVIYCSNNKIKSLDLSNNLVLERLYCSGEEIDIDGDRIGTGVLSNIDVSKNIALKYLYVDKNRLSSLDISNNIELIKFDCGTNFLTSIDVSNNTKLEWFGCYKNLLTQIDVSENTQLVELWCGINQLDDLNVSNNHLLKTLICYWNPFVNLDLTQNGSLVLLWTNDCHLATLDIRNCQDLKLNNVYVGHQFGEDGSLQEMDLIVTEEQNSTGALPRSGVIGAPITYYYANDNVNIVVN